MKSIKAMNDLRAAARSSVGTGVHCPRTGWWVPEPLHDLSARYIWQGAIMPGANGRNIQWRLAVEDPTGKFAQDAAWTPHMQNKTPLTYASRVLWPDCQD
ncbi:hypothetical protein SAMN04487912_105337 [Arthrobacter sp. cf158]|uniref:hypothetical protein n=1 Tax=Arthrobacter sp. cf158 TaxID=1761744 RepID=UPI00089BFC58|nr:hypothetical protein [Arthrobacter sp. cf158]SDW91221.1 hypothetical protein SAMN04487912_105337 [Arthrobacter sp. cf158]